MTQVLFLGCHCDDIELGCGATIHKHSEWTNICVTFCDYLKSRSEAALKILNVSKKLYYDYPQNDFHKYRQNIWSNLKWLEKYYKPDIVFTHEPDDHQDHVTLFNETIRNFKSTTILCYKPTIRNGLNHKWNWFETLKQENVDKKLEALKVYQEYQNKNYFKIENILAQIRIYAMNLDDTEFAEGFRLYKKVN